jgi:hypothetical protein
MDRFLRVVASKEQRPNYQGAITLAFWNGFSVNFQSLLLFRDLLDLILSCKLFPSYSMIREIEAFELECRENKIFGWNDLQEIWSQFTKVYGSQKINPRIKATSNFSLFNIEYFFDNPPAVNTNRFLLLTQPFLPSLKPLPTAIPAHDPKEEDSPKPYIRLESIESSKLFHLSNIESESAVLRPSDAQVPEFSTLAQSDPPSVIFCEDLLYFSKKSSSKDFYPRFGVLTLRHLGELHLIRQKKNIYKLISSEKMKTLRAPSAASKPFFMKINSAEASNSKVRFLPFFAFLGCIDFDGVFFFFFLSNRRNERKQFTQATMSLGKTSIRTRVRSRCWCLMGSCSRKTISASGGFPSSEHSIM